MGVIAMAEDAVLAIAAGMWPSAELKALPWEGVIGPWTVDQVCTVLEVLAAAQEPLPTTARLLKALEQKYALPAVTEQTQVDLRAVDRAAEDFRQERRAEITMFARRNGKDATWLAVQLAAIDRPGTVETHNRRIFAGEVAPLEVPIDGLMRAAERIGAVEAVYGPAEPLPPLPAVEGSLEAQAAVLVARWRSGERWDKSGISDELKAAMQAEWVRLAAEEAPA
jgi:hypothetical protein